MSVIAALLLLTLSWAPVLDGCDGLPLDRPDHVVYAVPYIVRAMVYDPGCPLDAAGQPQPCAREVWVDEWATVDPWLVVDDQPDPPVGVVYDVQYPRACNPAGCDNECEGA